MSGRTPILVIDDERDFLELLDYNLRLAGFEVHTACDGAQGLKEARALASRLAVILLDHTMPGMNGLEVLSELKYNPRTNTIPVFMLTAKSSISDVEQAFQLGADDYIAKPVEFQRLGAIIRRKLARPANPHPGNAAGGASPRKAPPRPPSRQAQPAQAAAAPETPEVPETTEPDVGFIESMLRSLQKAVSALTAALGGGSDTEDADVQPSTGDAAVLIGQLLQAGASGDASQGSTEMDACLSDLAVRLTTESTLDNSLEWMRARRVRCAPVFDPRQPQNAEKPVGTVRMRDLLLALRAGQAGGKKLSSLADCIAPQTAIVSRETSAARCIELMFSHDTDLLTVTVGGRVAGLLTRRSLVPHLIALLRSAENITAQVAAETPTEAASVRTVADAMTRNCLCLRMTDSLGHAAATMVRQAIRHLPVVDPKGKPIGILSDRDISESLPARPGAGLAEAPRTKHLFPAAMDMTNVIGGLRDVMSTAVISVGSADPLTHAANTMLEREVGCLPVLDAEGRVVGILTISDLLRFLHGVLTTLGSTAASVNVSV